MKAKLFSGLVLAALVVTPALADIAPPLVGAGPWAGEALMQSTYFPAVTIAWVDWVVLPPADYTGTGYESLVRSVYGNSPVASSYLYSYQVESNLANLNILTVQASYIASIGWATSQDLDVAGWGDHGLTGEHEFAVQEALVNATNASSVANATWFFSNGLNIGRESTVVWYTSPYAPTYGDAAIQDSIPPSPGIGRLPVPVPAPAAFVLGGLGLASLVAAKRRNS